MSNTKRNTAMQALGERIDTLSGNIAIYIYPREHNPPHFHARKAEYNAAISIETLDIIAGDIPPVDFKNVKKWASNKKSELLLKFYELNPTLRK